MKIVLLFFLLIATLAMADEAHQTQHRNPFLKPAQSEEAGDDLNQSALGTLKLTGTIQHDHILLAIVRDVKNHLYYLKLNDTMGLEKAKIVQISSDKISVEWMSDHEKFTDYLEL